MDPAIASALQTKKAAVVAGNTAAEGKADQLIQKLRKTAYAKASTSKEVAQVESNEEGAVDLGFYKFPEGEAGAHIRAVIEDEWDTSNDPKDYMVTATGVYVPKHKLADVTKFFNSRLNDTHGEDAEEEHDEDCPCQQCEWEKAQKHHDMSHNESTQIINFIKALSQKNYASANKYLQGVVESKLKRSISKAANK